MSRNKHKSKTADRYLTTLPFYFLRQTLSIYWHLCMSSKHWMATSMMLRYFTVCTRFLTRFPKFHKTKSVEIKSGKNKMIATIISTGLVFLVTVELFQNLKNIWHSKKKKKFKPHFYQTSKVMDPFRSHFCFSTKVIAC